MKKLALGFVCLLAFADAASAGWGYRGWYWGQSVRDAIEHGKKHGFAPSPIPSLSRNGVSMGKPNEKVYFATCQTKLDTLSHDQFLTGEQAKDALAAEMVTRGRPHNVERGPQSMSYTWGYPDHHVMVTLSRSAPLDRPPVTYTTIIVANRDCQE